MRRLLLALGLTACSGDAFFYLPPKDGSAADGDGENADAIPATEASADSGADASSPGDGSCHDSGVGVQSGGGACDLVMEVYCDRLKTCCNGGCNDPWTNGGAACRAHFTAEDCSSSAFTSKNVCYSDTLACTNAMKAGACNVIMQENPRAFCDMFWAQFP
jgi:hypothetical protein